MNRRHFAMALLAGTASMALTRTAVAQPAPAGTIPANEYLAMASKGSVFLEQTALDAYAKSSEPHVHRFAGSEVNEQTMLSAKLSRATGMDAKAPGLQSLFGAAVSVPFQVAGAAVGAAGSILGVPMSSDAQKSATIARLRATAAGPAYDAEFVNAQVLGHNEAYAIHGSYAQNGDDPALRRIAKGALPLIKLHLSQLARLQRMTGGLQG